MTSTTTVLAILAIVALSCTVQASVGFGANLIAQPIVYQFDPDLVPGPVLMATVFLSLLIVANNRQRLEVGPVGLAALGAVGGTAVASIIIGAVAEQTLALIVGTTVLAMVAATAAGPGWSPSPRNLLAAGVVGGFSGTTSGIGGPAVALLFTRTEIDRTRSILAGYFVLASSLAFGGLALAGRFGTDELVAGATLLPAAAVGFALALPIMGRIDRRVARPTILALSAGAAIVLVARTILNWS